MIAVECAAFVDLLEVVSDEAGRDLEPSARYRKLLDCLDELDARLKKSDTETILFALDDATPAALLMRASAYVDLTRYAKAVATAALAFIRG